MAHYTAMALSHIKLIGEMNFGLVPVQIRHPIPRRGDEVIFTRYAGYGGRFTIPPQNNRMPVDPENETLGQLDIQTWVEGMMQGQQTLADINSTIANVIAGFTDVEDAFEDLYRRLLRNFASTLISGLTYDLERVINTEVLMCGAVADNRVEVIVKSENTGEVYEVPFKLLGRL